MFGVSRLLGFFSSDMHKLSPPVYAIGVSGEFDVPETFGMGTLYLAL